ncbi:MAG: hypothetical protein HUJ53_06420 [Holdemanella sp.]|nr:hypothetical protein [Holdemanella sp.]
MKQRTFLSILLIVCMLTGCQSNSKDYTDDKKDALIEIGKDILKEEYELVSIDAYVDKPVSGKTQLTEYVYGEYIENGNTYMYYLNTETGELYSSKPYEKMESAVMNRISDYLGLKDVNVDWIRCDPFYLPNKSIEDYRPDAGDAYVYFERALPIDLEDIEDFLDHKEDRQVIHMQAGIQVSNDLENYHVQDFDFSKYGMDIQYISIENSTQKVEYREDEYTINHKVEPKLDYMSYEEVRYDDLILKSSKQRRYEIINEEGNYMVYTSEYDPYNDFLLQQSDSIQVTIQNLKEVKPRYSILCEDGNDIVSTTYNNGKIYWKQQLDGRWILEYEDRIFVENYYKSLKDFIIKRNDFNKEYRFE